ncbi:Uncharacterised protein [Suttonella ornithocola]|uniref:Tc1-like transposase DDE domain-containing protein n=1 Tax=Suttonella ornithocola TaxID=279832 RepID=A0A380MWJ4_9GAMM|nr:Uncharacterised protein [Suttonella ornithocola]
MFALRLYDGSINSDIFSHWVREALLPELPKNSVIVMDNAAFHKRSDIVKSAKKQNVIYRQNG